MSEGTVVSLSFTEEMKGFATLGESDYEQGFRVGKERRTALMFHLKITAEDVDGFIEDPAHEGVAEGYVECSGLGADLEGPHEVERGIFNLFVDQGSEPPVKRMLYRLHFNDRAGSPLTLVGFKLIEDDPGLDLWQDTTTLFTRILRGHTEPDGDAGAEIVAAGIIHIHLVDFAKQLTTFRVEPAHRVDAIGRFGALFAGEIWDVYAPAANR